MYRPLSRRWGLAAVIPLFAAAPLPTDDPATAASPAATRSEPAPPELSSESCLACHAAEHRSWAGSRHAAASTNEIFTASFKRHPRPWCLQCHAPLPEQQTAPATAPFADGVGCPACHVRDRRVVSSRELSGPGRKAHPMVEDPALKSSSFCARCHQFSASDPEHILAAQDTYQEWRRSVHAPAGRECQSCHMEQGTHAMPGAHDAAFLSNAVEVTVSRVKTRTVLVELHARDTGHRLPTGNPFHRMVFSLCGDAACEKPLASFTVGRRIATQGIVDESIPVETQNAPAMLKWQTVLPAKAPDPILWKLDYLFAEPGTEGADKWRTRVAAGQL